MGVGFDLFVKDLPKRQRYHHQQQVRYELKTPYRDGTTHVIFEPVDFIAKLAALVVGRKNSIGP